MKTVTLLIKKEDFYSSNFTDIEDCVITRALKEAGLNAIEGAGRIYKRDSGKGLTDSIKTPEEVYNLVKAMYAYVYEEKNLDNSGAKWGVEKPTKPAAIITEIQVPDHWIN